ncbi:unnamed protein product [Rotaria magnacalcarata]
MIAITCGVVVVAALIYMALPPKACDLTQVSQRNLYNYYGLTSVDNPLLDENAEQMGSINSKCHLFYDHLHLFPPGNLASSKSVIIQADCGAGKTQIRQCILSRLPPDSHILIEIFGRCINNYLDHFVRNINIPSEHPYEKIQKYWTKEDFLQVMLTEIASRFIDEQYFPILKSKRAGISLETRKQAASLLCFYSAKDSSTLCKMINSLLHEETGCFPRDCSIPCKSDALIPGASEMFVALSEKHRKVKVKLHTAATDASLRVLLAMHMKTSFSPIPVLERSYRDQLALLINFLRALQINISVVVDSLDESEFFFDKHDTNFTTLQTFVNSMTNDDILTLGLGNTGGGIEMSSACVFYIFIPRKPTASIKIPWTRPDKIPIINLKWDELQLINYADYVFDYLRSKSYGQCKPLPDICSLLGGRNLCIDTMKQLRHPRDFHIFFKVLAEHMGAVCTQRNPPFNANQEDLKSVLDETKLRVLKE